MAVRLIDKRRKAFEMYISGNHLQKDIAKALNVSQVSICDWKRMYKWDESKVHEEYKINVVNNSLKIIQQMQNLIINENRFPSPEETRQLNRWLNIASKFYAVLGGSTMAAKRNQNIETALNQFKQFLTTTSNNLKK